MIDGNYTKDFVEKVLVMLDNYESMFVLDEVYMEQWKAIINE
jgi:hypothetical protein